MYKILTTIALLMATSLVSAHNNECNFSTDYNIQVEENRLVFSRTQGDRFEFAGDRLLINDKPVALNESQRKASLVLQKNTREMVSRVSHIAVEGVELGLKAVTVVASTLFDDDRQMQQDLILPIEAFTAKIKANITPTSFNAEGLKLSLNEGFDNEFETAIETAMSKYAGKMAGNLLTKLFSGDSEELNDFEFRLENLDRQIETYVEANAKELEVKAQALCDDLVVLESIDSELESIEDYPQGGLFHQDRDDSFKLGGTRFQF